MRYFLFILEGSEVIPSVVRNEGTPPHETHEEEFLAETMQELHSITLMCKGGTFPRKQVNIASVRKLGPAMYSVPITLVKEPNKPVDKNAVKFVANVGGVDRSLRYAGVFEILRVLNAMNKSEIVNVQINYVKATFRRAINKSLFDMACTVTKRGRWEPSDKTNFYNKAL